KWKFPWGPLFILTRRNLVLMARSEIPGSASFFSFVFGLRWMVGVEQLESWFVKRGTEKDNATDRRYTKRAA
ncbi:MAG: hypothetical protein ABII26_09340, partial [Pseudomonadota bacterium]